jgi:hypothetical protein
MYSRLRCQHVDDDDTVSGRSDAVNEPASAGANNSATNGLHCGVCLHVKQLARRSGFAITFGFQGGKRCKAMVPHGPRARGSAASTRSCTD